MTIAKQFHCFVIKNLDFFSLKIVKILQETNYVSKAINKKEQTQIEGNE